MTLIRWLSYLITRDFQWWKEIGVSNNSVLSKNTDQSELPSENNLSFSLFIEQQSSPVKQLKLGEVSLGLSVPEALHALKVLRVCFKLLLKEYQNFATLLLHGYIVLLIIFFLVNKIIIWNSVLFLHLLSLCFILDTNRMCYLEIQHYEKVMVVQDRIFILWDKVLNKNNPFYKLR